MNVFLEKCILISGFFAFLWVNVLGKVLILMFPWSVQIISGQDSQSKFQMFTLFSGRHSPLQKRESTGASLLDWKSKHFNWHANEWKTTQPSLRVCSGKLSKWEPCKSFKIVKILLILWSVYLIHTNSLFWVIFEELVFGHFPSPNTSIRG